MLDLGCGAGRHAFETFRRGADVVAFDHDAEELREVAGLLAAMRAEGEAPETASARTVVGDALSLPFPDGSFDRVIASEILEHIPDDRSAMTELTRVLRPGGLVAVTVPRWLPERLCWALSEEYHQVDGGHVRIYSRHELRAKLAHVGLQSVGYHHAHALHSPYWWIKCVVGVNRDQHQLTRAYHQLLVWDILRRPWLTRAAESTLDPLIGKSLIFYLHKPEPTHALA